MNRWTSVFGALLACITATGCSTQTSMTVTNGPAQMPPQIDGTIKSIQAGDPSYVILKNTMQIGKGNKPMSNPNDKIKLPAGHFVSPGHWQSNGDTLDLFVGEGFSLMTETGVMSDNMPDQGFAGIVKSINSKEMVIQKVLYDTAKGGNAMKRTNQLVKIHLAPYTTVSINGDGTKHSASILKVGNPVLFVLIGPPSDYIATQITDFTSMGSSGWNMN